MNTVSKTLALAVALGAGLYAAPSIAANARHPYQNVNKRVTRAARPGTTRSIA